IGFPLLVKAVAGGGGKGMRTVVDPSELVNAVRAARSEAATAFGDAAVYFERRLSSARHIEVQLLGDPHGTVVPFVERECTIQRRIYAEDPDNDFLPSPGRVLQLRAPGGPGVRDDGGVAAGLDVSIFYDPMVSKLIAWGDDRPRAVARMRRALGEYLIAGIKTTIPFSCCWLISRRSSTAGFIRRNWTRC